MLFSAAGISTRSRTGSFARMTSSAKASAAAAPPMSFFISAMALPGLMSSPPVSKQMPLPTMRHLGGMLGAPAQVDEAWRAVARASDRVDHREIVGEQAGAFRHLDARIERGGELARGGLELGGAEIVGGRVDEVPADIQRLGEGQNLLLARAVGEDEARGLAAIGRFVTGEAVAAGEETKRGQLRIGERRGKAIIARGQRAWQSSRQQGNLRRPILASGPEQDTAKAPLFPRQRQHRALLAAPVLRLDPSPLGLAQGLQGGVIGRGDKVDRQRLGAGRQQQSFQEAARGLERHWLVGHGSRLTPGVARAAH